MNILGISCFYHDSAVALVRDGRLVAAAEEERFNRKKHYFGFPKLAIEYCLKEAGIGIEDIDCIGFYEKPLLKFGRIVETCLGTYPKSYPQYIRALPLWLSEKLHVPKIIRKELGYKREILFIEHHLSHAASSFFVSPFEEAAILTLDGVGEWATATHGIGRGNQIEVSHEIRWPHSLGMIYSAFTGHLGFQVNEGEYKVMGLAPYGKPEYYDELMKEVIHVDDEGGFRLNMDYFAYHYRLKNFSSRFFRKFGPPCPKGKQLEPRYANLAASIQKVCEEVMLRATNHLHRRTGLKRLCMAGGVALNCVANGKVLRETPFEEIYIQPAAGDAGGSVGVAMYIWHAILGKPREFVMRHAYWGPAFTRDDCRAALDARKVVYREYGEEDLVRVVARLIAERNVVGWYRERMEFGPRALGHRSILGDARSAEMKEIINEKIKHRELFRPFAPSVLAEKAHEYFDLAVESPFMLLVGPVQPDKRSVIPAITHVDGTARVQTVTKEQNGVYYDLIRAFGDLTGVPVIINTSFNVAGEPIVMRPEEAYRCFARTDMDWLVLDRFVVGKKDNPGLTTD